MKSTSVRIITLVLLLAITASMFSGCAGEAPADTGGVTAAPEVTPSGTDEGTTAPEVFVADYLPDKDYGGYEFRVVGIEEGAYTSHTSLYVEEETGDTVNDAIYARNKLIEDRYNIVFKPVYVPALHNLTETFKKTVTAGADDFDMSMLICRDAWSTALTGAVAPVDSLPYLDPTQPWYAQDVNRHITIGNKLYFAYSDECLNMFEMTICTLFNKKLVADLALENMYNLVNQNEWTIDKFFSLSKGVSSDINGDGAMDDTDRYGILSQFDMLYPCFWVSSNVKTVDKDENDMLVFTGNSEKLYGILDNLYQNLLVGEKIMFDPFTDKYTSYNYAPRSEDSRQVSTHQFERNLGLFYVTGVGSVPYLRGMETDFGILPFPKYDSAQDKYYSRVLDGWIHCVPITNPDLERTSVIMEALAVESRNITIPAYFETALRTKYARDNESHQMLDIIFANRTMDIGDTFYYSPVRLIYTDLLEKKQNTFSSAVEKNADKIAALLDTANAAARELG